MFRNKDQRRKKPANQKEQYDACSIAYENKIGIQLEEAPVSKVGYLANCKTVTHIDSNENECSALMMFFIGEDGSWTKCTLPYKPYFYLLVEEEAIREIVFYLNKEFADSLATLDVINKEDLDLVNHLSGKQQKFLKLSFRSMTELIKVRNELKPIVAKNKKQKETQDAYEGWYDQTGTVDERVSRQTMLSKIVDMREHDVSYHTRVMIDNEIRCSFWYEFTIDGPICTGVTHLKDKLDKADLRVMAWDIECTKQPLKFPDVKFDQIMMISYIVDGQGFLITNREIVAEDVKDFEYAPKPEYDVGIFTIFNEPDERSLIKKFFDHIIETKPAIFTTYNGDTFDWPFVEGRAEHHKLKLQDEIGIFSSGMQVIEYSGRFSIHMDCLYWVNRDAYLPQGSRGLKAVTKAKLGYDPVEIDYELQVEYARTKPQELAEYSVSDSVATYFLYMKMIHDFIFALCTIIPTNPDEVLRRGSGVLCEYLLMAQATRGNIIYPNKQVEDKERYYDGRLLESDTYIGGHVECLQNGIYRSDIPVKFKMQSEGYDWLIEQATNIMDFALDIESGGLKPEDCENYGEIKAEIIEKLQNIKAQCPVMNVEPLIYHVDVAAMYPNIILSNRLQPVAIVNEQICAGCVFNKESNDCKRQLDWEWKGELYPLNKPEYERVKLQLKIENDTDNASSRFMFENTEDYAKQLKKRTTDFARMNYNYVKKTVKELRTDTVCMRENPFYVDTVRDFRDRRYEFKRLVKVWLGKLAEAKESGDAGEIETAKNRVSLYESLQLAHKIILNSFYGYVMKKGARWYSMEMAAMVTHTGGNIIKNSRALFDQIGLPLELDTDGIWTCLPNGFPEKFMFKLKNGKKVPLEFPCTMCNLLIYEKYGNKQYQTLVDKKTLTYEKRLEMSVFFEIDGPYKAMVIPASKEENKMLKKRYAVFTHSGKISELKGFELKRRGELQIIKIFQGEVFEKFLEGKTLQECYDACGEVADRWYDILESEGDYVNEAELIEYIGEQRVISKTLEEYGTQKGTAITCARRLAELLGPEVAKDKGLNLSMLITKKPVGEKVAGRAIPTQIFSYPDEAVKKKFLRKWTGDSGMQDYDLRQILDWDYYKERLAGTIMKIVTIPAALQKCMNPVPRIKYPDWLHKRLKEQNDAFKQKDMKHFFKVADIEDIAKSRIVPKLTNGSAVNKLSIGGSKPSQPVEELKMEDCPAPEENFGSWLKHQKCNWRKIRKDLKTEKKVVGQRGAIEGGPKIGGGLGMNKALSQFMRLQDDTVLNSNWHIMQIQPTFEPGQLRIWAMTEQGQMFQVKLGVNKQIYINSKVTSDDLKEFKKVQKVLPRNRKTHQLYEWESPEETFLEKYHNIKQQHLLNQNIEGIYETKVPANFRALIELGAIVRPKKNQIPRSQQALGRTYRIKELENKPSTGGADSVPYLPDEFLSMIFLRHTCSGNRHFWAMYTETTKEVDFFVVNPATMAKNQTMQNLKTIFGQTVEEKELSDIYQDWEVTNQHYVSELAQALKLIDQRLKEYKEKNKMATLIVLQSSKSAEFIQLAGLTSLHQEFPVLKLNLGPGDNDLPALEWMKHACKMSVVSLPDAIKDVQVHQAKARYAFVPICNLGDDPNKSLIDTLLGRQLTMGNQLIWYSDTSQPDLGGNEDKNFRRFFQEEIESPEQNVPGFYRYYTVEIRIINLALNTIAQSEYLPEFDEASAMLIDTKHGNKGAKATQFGQEFDTDLDEFVTCANAFAQLKKLMKCWIYDLHAMDDDVAAELIMNVYRWVTDPNSKMYDPLLHRLIHKLMKKSFLKLLQQFKQYGCEVIHADFNKVWLQTKKRDYEDAEAHVNFVTKQIKENQMFSYLDLVPSEYWRILLFKDSYNYGGVKESHNERCTTVWNISKHLPEALQTEFRRLVGEYLLKVYRHHQKKREASLTQAHTQDDIIMGEDTVSNASPTKKGVTSLMDDVEDFKKEFDHEYICELIKNHFGPKLFTQVDNYRHRKTRQDAEPVQYESSDEYSDEDNIEARQTDINADVLGADFQAQDMFTNAGQLNTEKRLREKERKRREAELQRWEFPQHVSSFQKYTNPALEYTKMICEHIFGIEEAFKLPAQNLKRNLLRLIQVKEFSDEASSFNNPSLILVLPDVICDSCLKCQNVDICRDNDLNEPDQVDNAGNPVPYEWFCSCGATLSLDNIERRLLDILNRRMVTYQMQDLQCVACKMVNNRLMNERCECTSTFIQTQGNTAPEKLKNQNLLNQMTDIKVFTKLLRNFADLHMMVTLKDTAEKMLNLMQVTVE